MTLIEILSWKYEQFYNSSDFRSWIVVRIIFSKQMVF